MILYIILWRIPYKAVCNLRNISDILKNSESYVTYVAYVFSVTILAQEQVFAILFAFVRPNGRIEGGCCIRGFYSEEGMAPIEEQARGSAED